MLRFYVAFSCILVTLMLFTLPVFAAGSVGLTYTAGGGDTDVGVLGAFETPVWVGDLSLDGNLKYGQGVDVTLDADVTVGIYKALGLRPFLSFVGKGTSLDTVGGNFDAGLSGNLKFGDTDVGLGIFGRASAEFAPTLRDELLAAGVDGVTAGLLDNPALDAPATDGLPILRPDTPLHLTIYTSLEWHRIDFRLRWMGEASLDSPIHQYRVDVERSYDLAWVALGIQGNVIIQSHESNLDGEYNTSLFVSREW